MTMSTLASVLGAATLYVLLRVLTSLLTDEAKGWLGMLTEALIKSAVGKLPPEERPRWDEEWRAEVAARATRPISCLLFTIGIRRRAAALGEVLESSGTQNTEGDVVDPKVQASQILEQYDMGLITAAECRELVFEIRHVPVRYQAGALYRSVRDAPKLLARRLEDRRR